MNERVPEGWGIRRLGDSLISLPKSKLPSGVSDVDGYYKFYVCSSEILKSFHCEMKKPAVLFSTGGEAAVHYASGKYSYSMDVWAVQFIENLTNEYAYRFLEHRLKQINYRGFQGSSIRHLDKKFVKKLQILTPPLSEQKKIATILSSVDEVIENTQKQIDKLQDLKKATMNRLLTRGIGHTEFKGSEFGRIPREWKVHVLGLGIDILPGFPFESKKFTNCPSYIGLIRIRDLIKQKLGTFYKGDYEKKYVVTKGDILIGMDGDFNIVKWKSADALLNQRICKLKLPPKSLFDLDFILYDLQKELYLIHQITSSTTVKHLSIKDIRNIKKAFPPLSEQKKIATILTSIDEKIENTQEKLGRYQSLKKALMQDLLTGRVRVRGE